MTFEAMMQRAIFQYNADWDDYEDYAPHVDAYINDGYDQILYALTKYHLDELQFFYTLSAETDLEVAPGVPEWTHLPICDYATYMLYRNGNPQKQQRGQEFLSNFLKCLQKCENMGGKVKLDTETGEMTFSQQPKQFYNVYP
jgi:hypothetical protein